MSTLQTIAMLEKRKCTGCGACDNKCPVNAIRMEMDSDGFLFPVIDQTRCTNCGLCVKVCPVINIAAVRKQFARKTSCYSMMAEDDLRARSSSGGMFMLLAEKIISEGGVVCGAAYTPDYLEVKHVVVRTLPELSALRGAKYLQSDVGNVYRELKVSLDNGQPALFCGCSCQVAALKCFLGKDYEKLLTVDLICHGVPSPLVYRKYVEDVAHGRTLQRFDFREKAFWGWGAACSMFFNDGSVFRENCFKDRFYRGFSNALFVRRSCAICPYTNTTRIGDFSLGDFWGISEIDPAANDGKGTSLVLVNTKKGQAVVEEIAPKCKHWKKQDLQKLKEIAKRHNGQLHVPLREHFARSYFFELLNAGKPFSEAFEEAINYKFDVGVVGWWYNLNYGGTLTYFALHQTLRKLGCSVLMIAKSSEDPNYKPAVNSIPYRFALKNYHISKNHSLAGMTGLNDHCRAFISGSDQLFNPILWQWSGPQYFLSFASTRNNLISYASSFGNSFRDPANRKNMMGYWLKRFNALSVRETYGVEICKDEFGLDAQKVVDPVFLCDRSEYLAQAKKSSIKKESPYLLNFILDPNAEKSQLIRKISERFQIRYTNVVNLDNASENVKNMNLPNTVSNASIEDFLAYYRDADFVITDSFHGTCFSIIFRKQFVSIANVIRGEKRFESVLAEAGLLDRLVWGTDAIKIAELLNTKIDYDVVYARLDPKIRASLEWLRNAIYSPKPIPGDIMQFDCVSEYLMNRILKLEEQQRKLEKKLTNSNGNETALRKLKRCLKQHGFKYTVKRVLQKLAGK